MDALDLADGELAGIVSWYSIIHATPEELSAYFAEFGRVLAPGGHLLVAFFESEGGPAAAFDHKVALAFRWPPDGLAVVAREAGFAARLRQAATTSSLPTGTCELADASRLVNTTCRNSEYGH